MKNERKNGRRKRSIDRLILIDMLKWESEREKNEKDTFLSAPSSVEEQELDTCINRIQSKREKKESNSNTNCWFT